MKNTLFILSLILILSACSPKNTPVMNPDQERESIAEETKVKAQQEVPAFNNKVDILFVIDNSSSMKNYVDSVKANIDLFIKSLDKKSNKKNERALEYRIAVTSVWDEYKFNVLMPRRIPQEPVVVKNGTKEEIITFKKTKPFAQGELRPLRLDDKSYLWSEERYIKNNTVDKINKLKHTLNIGFETHTCFKDPQATTDAIKLYNTERKLAIKPTDKDDYDFGKHDKATLTDYLFTHCGAENEEIFSPISAAIKRAHQQWQAATPENREHIFPSPDVKQFVVIIISDAEDNVREYKKENEAYLTASMLNTDLQEFVNDGSAVVYGAINHISPSNECAINKRDNGSTLVDDLTSTENTTNKPIATKVLELITSSGGQAFNICKGNYGNKLTQFGDKIREEVLKPEPIIRYLEAIPQAGTLKVSYNGKPILPDLNDSGNGYVFTSSLTIRIGVNTPLEYKKGAGITLDYVSVDGNNIRTGHATAINR